LLNTGPKLERLELGAWFQAFERWMARAKTYESVMNDPISWTSFVCSYVGNDIGWYCMSLLKTSCLAKVRKNMLVALHKRIKPFD
jgi:hypothetical protein